MKLKELKPELWTSGFSTKSVYQVQLNYLEVAQVLREYFNLQGGDVILTGPNGDVVIHCSEDTINGNS